MEAMFCYFCRKSNRGTQRQCLENICSENDLRSRILGAFVVKFRACLPSSCGFRPFDFYSKLKIEKSKNHNRDFQCLIPQELTITNLQSQLSILVSKKHKIEKQFSMFWKSKIQNWKWSVGRFYFLLLRKRKTKRYQS